MVATSLGIVSGYGAMVVHGLNVDEASEDGFFRGVWNATAGEVKKQFQSGYPGKALMHGWDVTGTVVGHLFEGGFAAQVFLEGTGLIVFPWVAWPLRVSLSLAVMLECLSELHCLVKANSRNPYYRDNPVDPRTIIEKLAVAGLISLEVAMGVLHSLPVAMGASEAADWLLRGGLSQTWVRLELPGEARVYGMGEIAILLAAIAFFVPPNAKAFRAVVGPPVESTAESARDLAGRAITAAGECLSKTGEVVTWPCRKLAGLCGGFGGGVYQPANANQYQAPVPAAASASTNTRKCCLV
jgi:hypothetical protein